MISKNLFIRLLNEDLKRRIWSITLSILVFLLFLPINCALTIERYTSTNDDLRWVHDNLLTLISVNNNRILIIVVICSIVCGLSGFFYLHSRKKVDLYHSIPVRREVLFAVSYINGFLIFFIPYIINVLLSLIIIKSNDFMSADIIKSAFQAIALNALFFCLTYSVVVIAMMLTGNIIIGALGAAVLLLYGPMIDQMLNLYYGCFFASYYKSYEYTNVLTLLSPLGYMSDLLIHIREKRGIGFHIIIALLATMILIAVALFLYKKRPSEAAGNAMALRISRPIIKFMLVIPLSLGGGIIFRGIANKNYNGWFIFGLIFALILSYAVVEVIYNFDIRSAFHNKKQLLACAVITGTIVCIFQFDLLHYDSYIPKKNNISSMSVAIQGLDNNLSYYKIGDGTINYMNGVDYQLKYMEMTNFDVAYEMAELGSKSLKNYKLTNNFRRSGDIRYYMYNTAYDASNFTYIVKYSLSNGKDVYRKYQLSIDDNYDRMKEIYANIEFKKAHYQINQMKLEDIQEISLSNSSDFRYDRLSNDGNSITNIKLGDQEKEALIETYKEELNKLTLDDLANYTPLATMQIIMKSNYSDFGANYYIYPSFEKTIALCKKLGFDATKGIQAEDIKEIQVVNESRNVMTNESGYSYETNSDKKAYAEKYGFSPVIYKENTEIAAILPYLISSYDWTNNQFLNKKEDNIGVTVVFQKDSFGYEAIDYYYFKQGKVPDFVKEAIK